MFKNILRNLEKKKLKSKRFESLFETPPPNEYVSLDCETTGLNPKKDEILSIGAVLIKDNKILMRQTFNIFVKPSKLINPESIKIHHLRQTDLENALEPEIAIFQLLNFIGSRPIVGYYIEFDIAMISKNILNEHPDKWLKGTYLEYVNTQCVIINKPDGTKITSEDRKGVNYTEEFLQLIENSKEKVTFWEVLWIFISDPILIAILIFGFIVQYYFLKAKADYFRTIFRKK